MILPVTALMAAVLTFWYGYLAMVTSFARARHQVSLGMGESNTELTRIVRVHGNAAEYIGLFIILSALLEYHGLRPEVLYVLGSVFVVGRVLHRSAILQASVRKRIWAMQLTLWPLMIAATILMYTWFAQTFIV